MIKLSNGNEVSQETVDVAVEEYTKRHPEKYIFQAGDVIKNDLRQTRIIFKERVTNDIKSISIEDGTETLAVNQKDFVSYGYRKIGVLADYFDK